MPNQKANRITLQMPPLLSLAHNEFVVDNTLANVEENNAPFINKKIQPLYKRELDKAYYYDKSGNKYNIENNWLKKNGTNLFQVEPYHFVKTEITDRLDQYIAYDYTTDKEAWATFDYSLNKVTFNYNGHSFTSEVLFYEGQIVEARAKIIGNKAYLIVIYRDNHNNQKMYFVDSDDHHFIKELHWWRQKIRNAPNASYIPTAVTKDNIYPLIQIAQISTGWVGISLVAEYSTVMNSYNKAVFDTFFYNGTSLFEYGNELVPTTASIQREVETTTSAYFRVLSSTSRDVITGNVIVYDGEYYDFDEHGPTVIHNFPAGYAPIAKSVVVIDGTEYSMFGWSAYRTTTNVVVGCSDPNISYNVKVNGVNETVLVNTNYFDYQDNVINSVAITWVGEETVIPKSYYDKNYYISRTTTSTETISYLAYPNVVLDNGNMYCIFSFDNITGDFTNNNALAQNNYIVESGRIANISVSGTTATYTCNSIEEVKITSDYNHVRSNSYSVGQNFFQSTVKLNNNGCASPQALYTSSTTIDGDNARYMEYTNSNAYDLTYFPGTNRASQFNYYSKGTEGPGEDLAVFTAIGARVKLSNHFNLLYNTYLSYSSTIQGISYSETDESMGTLLTEWQSIDPDFYIASDGNSVVYRDVKHRYWKISIEAGNEIFTFLDDKFVVVNTTSFWNCYDVTKNKKFHYATDYNDRTLLGVKSLSSVDLSRYVKINSRLRATAINASFRNVPRDAITSMILLQTTVVVRGAFDEETGTAYNCACPEDSDTQPIDIYYSSKENSTRNIYRYSLYPYRGFSSTYQDFDKIGTTYVTNNSTLITPNIFSRYINGAGNNDNIIEDITCYALTYYNNKPYFNYSVSSELDDVQHFFVLQGQFYAIIDDKIYSVIYTNGIITEMEAIIDIRGIKFLGNTPAIAFFWSQSMKAFFSFTGDAVLEHLYDGNKFNEISDVCYYDESTQSLFIPTDRGLLVFGPKNSFILPDINDVKNIQFTEDHITHITHSDKTTEFAYYPAEGFVSNNVKLETSFYGTENMTSTTIDKWNITLQTNDITKASWIKVGVRSLTDITVKNEEKTFEIKPTDWDKWSKCTLITYNPSLIKGQGIRLYLETPESVAVVTPHVMTNNGGTLSNHNV